MTFTITTEDPKEARRLAKCTDMAIALFDIQQMLRELDKSDSTYIYHDELRERINFILEGHGIVIEDILS
jgi:hypothetical protein